MVQLSQNIRGLPSDSDIDQIAEALGAAARLAYAPPHIYPMSAPSFIKSANAIRKRSAGGALGLYIHIPFCNYACNFCFYAKRVGDTREQMERYVQSLIKELEWVQSGTELAQLYVGGGTPTVLPADLLDTVLSEVFSRMTGGGVHTVECSPESITDAHLDVLKNRGVGRVSMGIQSLKDEVLDDVHRRHNSNLALEACDLLVSSGLTINVDLIYGLPGQSEASFREDFAAVAERGVNSVTVYNLRVNERTVVGKSIGPEDRLDLARLIRWRAVVKQTAEELGYTQTRWHLFQRLTSKANTQHKETSKSPTATKFEDKTGEGNQFGIGMSARSRLGGTIYRNHSDFHHYIARVESGESPVEEVFHLGEPERRTRFIAQSLGDGNPLNRAAFESNFGRSFDEEHGEVLSRLLKADLVAEEGNTIVLTDSGKLVHDLVTLSFYPQHVRQWLRAREEEAISKGRIALN